MVGKDKSYRFRLSSQLFKAAQQKAAQEDLSIAQVLRRFLMAWVTGEIELPLRTEFREDQPEQE
jgi:predicted DNA binding CopG/RHH family protein